MELKEFVKKTLTQIAAGVEESLESVRDSGGYVNPATRTNTKISNNTHFASMPNGSNVFLIDFDVAITVDDKAGTGAEAKLKVASFLSLGVGGDSENKSSSTNRISFQVPLALPVDPISENELKSRDAEQKRKSQEFENRSRNKANRDPYM